MFIKVIYFGTQFCLLDMCDQCLLRSSSERQSLSKLKRRSFFTRNTHSGTLFYAHEVKVVNWNVMCLLVIYVLLGPLLPTGINLNPKNGYVIAPILECGVELFIHFQTSAVEPLKFGKG